MTPDAGKELLLDPRLEDIYQRISFDKISTPRGEDSVAIFSHEDDEGVTINGGRPGAKMGPKMILKFLGRMVVRNSPEIFLVKTESKKKKSLLDRHQEAEEKILDLFQKGYRVITLGGGHDYGFPDASAFYLACRGTVINVDAHLDVRPVFKGRLNSGTPFFRFSERFGGQTVLQWGIQPHCNAAAHETYAKKSGMSVFGIFDPAPVRSGPCGLSICLDAFQGIRGVSAPAAIGLNPRDGFHLIQTTKHRSPWLGLYECAPNLDPLHHDSARLAALYAYYFVHRSLNS